MVEINWTDEAEKWLKDIHDYIALDNPSAAKSVVEGISFVVCFLLLSE